MKELLPLIAGILSSVALISFITAYLQRKTKHEKRTYEMYEYIIQMEKDLYDLKRMSPTVIEKERLKIKQMHRMMEELMEREKALTQKEKGA